MWRDLCRVDLRCWNKDRRIEDISYEISDAREVRSSPCGDEPRWQVRRIVRVKRQTQAGSIRRGPACQRWCWADCRPALLYAQDPSSSHSCPFDPERQQLALEKAAGIGAQIPEFIYFDPRLKAVDAFDARVGVTVALEVPETEELVVEPSKY